MQNRFQFSALIIFSALVWGAVLQANGANLSWDYIKPYGITTLIVTFAIVIFDRLLWHWWPLGGWLVTKPHIDGQWDVELLSTYIDTETNKVIEPIHGTMIVTQTHSSLLVRVSTERQESHTLGYDIRDTGGGMYEVMGIYQSDPAFNFRGGSPIHYGTFKLKLERFPQESLVGHYWTDRNTSGRFRATNRRARTKTSSAPH